MGGAGLGLGLIFGAGSKTLHQPQSVPTIQCTNHTVYHHIWKYHPQCQDVQTNFTRS